MFADFNFKDVDGFRTFYNIAKDTGRKLVVKLKDCYYLKHLSKDPNLGIPNYDDEDIVIFKPKQATGTYANGDYYGDDAEIILNSMNPRPTNLIMITTFQNFNR